jgi:hypothetical protein
MSVATLAFSWRYESGFRSRLFRASPAALVEWPEPEVTEAANRCWRPDVSEAGPPTSDALTEPGSGRTEGDYA